MATEACAIVLVALGVGTAWLINLDLFSVLAVPIRDHAIGVTVTGLRAQASRGSAGCWSELPCRRRQSHLTVLYRRVGGAPG